MKEYKHLNKLSISSEVFEDSQNSLHLLRLKELPLISMAHMYEWMYFEFPNSLNRYFGPLGNAKLPFGMNERHMQHRNMRFLHNRNRILGIAK